MQTHSLMEAAGLLGVNKTTLQTWLSQGCPAIERADRASGRAWKICIADVVSWRIERAVADAVARYGDSTGISREEADRRRAVALAQMAEIELDDRLQQTVNRTEAIGIFADFCQALRSGMSNGLDKIATRAATITNPAEIRAMGEAEWTRAIGQAREEFARLWDERFGSKGSRVADPAE